MAESQVNNLPAPAGLKEVGLTEINLVAEQAQNLQEQVLNSNTQNESLLEQLNLSHQERSILQESIEQAKMLLYQISQDKQALVEKIQIIGLELQRLVQNHEQDKHNLETLHYQLLEENTKQQQDNLRLEAGNRQLQVEENRLTLEKQSLNERNSGLQEDILLLEEISQTLEQHAQELEANAQLLRERNRRLRQANIPI